MQDNPESRLQTCKLTDPYVRVLYPVHPYILQILIFVQGIIRYFLWDQLSRTLEQCLKPWTFRPNDQATPKEKETLPFILEVFF